MTVVILIACLAVGVGYMLRWGKANNDLQSVFIGAFMGALLWAAIMLVIDPSGGMVGWPHDQAAR